METLAYLHLALACETSTDTDRADAISTTENPKLLIWLKQQLSASAAIPLLGLSVALGISGIANKALAVVQQGDRGKDVTDLQQRLIQLGYFKGNITGYFGSVTEKSVTQFQKDRGLRPDGVVGDNTQASLIETERQLSKSQLEVSASDDVWQLGDRSDEVVNIQQKLATAGFSSGEKGVFDDATENAVREFQQAKGLKVDGIVGAQTLAALPAIGKSNNKKTSTQSRPWYEDKSAPLTPFTN